MSYVVDQDKFKVGDVAVWKKVYDYHREEFVPFKYNEDEDVSLSCVIDAFKEDQAYVTWDDDYKKPPAKVPVDELWTKEEFKEVEASLEKQFNLVQEEIKKHLKTASESIYEAQKIAETLNLDLSDMGVGRNLFGALNNAGWRTSSFGC
jgi:hypothetical protein